MFTTFKVSTSKHCSTIIRIISPWISGSAYADQIRVCGQDSPERSWTWPNAEKALASSWLA